MMHGKSDELVRTCYTLYEVRMPVDPANFPARRAEQFTRAAHRYRPFKHARQGRDGNMLCIAEKQMLIDLIGYHKHIMFNAQFGNQCQLLSRKDSPTRIVWGIEDDCSCF